MKCSFGEQKMFPTSVDVFAFLTLRLSTSKTSQQHHQYDQCCQHHCYFWATFDPVPQATNVMLRFAEPITVNVIHAMVLEVLALWFGEF